MQAHSQKEQHHETRLEENRPIHRRRNHRCSREHWRTKPCRQSQNQNNDNQLPLQSLRVMAEVYGQIKTNYVHNETDEKILEGAVKGMVSGLDPHSEYMDKKGYQDMREGTSGEFGGLGMEIGQEDGFVKVVAPIEDTPAERAGVKSGDFIVKIDNESTRGMSVSDAVKKMRGKPGTNITLTLSRKDAPKPIVVKLTRAIIKVRSVRHHLLENGYGYIRISQFQEPTVPAMADAIAALTKENGSALKGLVLDFAMTQAACSMARWAYRQHSWQTIAW